MPHPNRGGRAVLYIHVLYTCPLSQRSVKLILTPRLTFVCWAKRRRLTILSGVGLGLGLTRQLRADVALGHDQIKSLWLGTTAFQAIEYPNRLLLGARSGIGLGLGGGLISTHTCMQSRAVRHTV